MNKPKKKTFAVGIGLATLLCTAQLAAAETQTDRLEKARKQMELGQEAFNDKRYTEAAVYFEAAFEASPFAAFLYNAGLAAERGGDAARAVSFYEQYLEKEPEASDREKVQEKVDALKASLSTPETEGEPDTGAESASPPDPDVQMKSLISVHTNPEEAKIRILDPAGNEVTGAVGPLALTVERGTYVVEASHPDYRTVTTEISVSSGQVYVVVVEMSQGSFLGFLKVATDIPGAAVYIDKQEDGRVGVTPYGNVIPVGAHRIWVEKPGYTTIEQQLEVGVGEEVELTLQMERLPFGALKVKTNIPDVQIAIDGKPAGAVNGESEFTRLLPEGTYRVRASAEDMKDYEADVTVEKGKESRLLVRMNPKPSRTSGFVTAGFSLAVFGAGGAFGGIALSRKNDLEADRNNGRLAQDDPRTMEGFLWAVGADLSFAVGTILAGMSIYYFLRDPLPPSEGKAPKPEDFTENPTGMPEGTPANTETTADRAARRAPVEWMLTPTVTRHGAGFGLQLAF